MSLRKISLMSFSQIDVVNGLQLLTAKPVTYLVNLSEKDYVRKKNKWWANFFNFEDSTLRIRLVINVLRLAKIKAWIDTNNPGDPLIPFSVALEERLASLSPEEKKEEEMKISATSALPKITQAGYSSLDVSSLFSSQLPELINCLIAYSLFYLWSRWGPRVDNQKGDQSTTSCRRNPVCIFFLPFITPLTNTTVTL